MSDDFDMSVGNTEYDTSTFDDTNEEVSEIPDDVPEDEPEMTEEDDLSDDIPEDVPEDEPEISEDNDLSDDIPEDVPEDEPEISEEDDLSDDIPEDVPEDEPELTEDDLSEDIPEDVPEDEPELTEENDLSDAIPEDVPENEPELTEEDDLSEDIPEDVPDDEPEMTEEDDLPDDISEDVSDDEPEPMENDFTEDIPEDVSDDESESMKDDLQDAFEEQDEDASDNDDSTTDEVSEETTSETEDTDAAEQISDTQDKPLDDTATDEVSEETTSETEDTDAAEQISDTQDEPMDDTATEDTADDTTSDVNGGNSGEQADTQKETADEANEFNDGAQDDPSKVLKRDELDLLKSGNEAINQRLEAQADDYRDKGMSEDEIRDRLAADKWNFQKEFLEDAFLGQDVSPNVFNGLSENGAKDRLADIEQSETLRNQLRTDEANNSSEYEWDEEKWGPNPFADAKDEPIDDKTKLANDIMRDYNVGKADFTDFDPDVAVAVSDAIKDAKNDFPDLDVKYIGSIDTQVNGIKNELTDFYREKLASIPNTGWSEEQIERAVEKNANDFITRAKLNDTNGTFAWSLNIPEAADPTGGGLSKYNGVAINKDYASDNAKFTAAKVREVATKHKPIGCDTPRATVDHELGHEIDKLLGAANDPEINDLYNKMMRSEMHSTMKYKEMFDDARPAKDVLSEYSKKDVKEFIAECYSEYRNNPQPREYSTKVYQRLKYLYSQRKVN